MTIEETYQSIADRFATCVHDGLVTTDDYLSGKRPDQRRGLTLLARPNAQTIGRIQAALKPLHAMLGAQYEQPAEDLHVTVLSVIPGSSHYPQQRQWLEPCREAVAEAVASLTTALPIHFCGLIGSPDGLLAKGFPQGDALKQLRSRLLGALERRGLEAHFVRRYPMVAAHMTVVRFVRQPVDLRALHRALGDVEAQPLGATTINTLSLVENDWYMRGDTLNTVDTYTLPR